MFKTFNISKILFLSAISAFAVVLIIKPQICQKSISGSIIICSGVIIPSLFPFSVCMLYILKSGIEEKITKIVPFSTFIMILSMLGGYPIGAKLISEAVSENIITPKDGRRMINYCVNAGPGFIVSAVGCSLLKSNKLGYILLISNTFSSLIINIFSKKINVSNAKKITKYNPADAFIQSAGEAANSVLGICSFVILFSVLTSYIEYFSTKIRFLRYLAYFAEVTTAIGKTRNIYIISFLLGFSGICIWCQILSVGKILKIRILKFAVFRILHGFLSMLITVIILKLFPINLPTFSTINSLYLKFDFSKISLGISIIILGIVFIISLASHQKNKKILEEII